MNEQEIKQSLELISKRLETIERSVEKTRKYFLTTLIVSIVVFVLPLIGLVFAIPAFLSTYSSVSNF